MQKFGTESFSKFSGLIYRQFGIHYNETKREILQTKLTKLMSRHNIGSYEECYGNLSSMSDATLLSDFANEITVNYTSFFRESVHFDFLKENAAGLLEEKHRKSADREFRIWSAACSTGEEPYTLAMVLAEALPAGSAIPDPGDGYQ